MRTKYYAVCPVCKIKVEFRGTWHGDYWRCKQCRTAYPDKEYLSGWDEVQVADAWEEAYRTCPNFSDKDRGDTTLAIGFKAGWEAALAIRKDRPPEDLQ